MTTTTYRKDYQPPVFTALTVELDFDLYEDHAIVTNYMTLQREHAGDLHLYGDELELIRIELDDKKLNSSEYKLENGDLYIANVPDSFSLLIITRIEPQENTKLTGLYRSKGLFCTQCEAEGFRRITFSLDRPDVLSRYTTKITADKNKYPILLSNGNLHSSGDLNNGRHWVKWEDPFKKPSYLFALVAGNLSCVKDEYTTMNNRKVDLRIYVEPGNEDKCAHAMNSVKKAMQWDEQEFGREYDLDIYMIVAVSDFNMGAMENKGLNIFNAKYVLARPDTATDQDYMDVEGVVGHEYFHNWTGNRVTCRDWFQLSLKEGLTVYRDQEFSGDMNSRDVNRILDVKTLRTAQFPEDAGSMAHPVRPDSYQEINNFYTATIYNKGAEVIRMQRNILGKEGFKKGMDLYFERNDGKAVTIDDFVSAMADANNVDLTQFKNWYSQAGTPVVKVTEDYQDGNLTLTFSQSCPPTPDAHEKKPFHIPIKMAIFDRNGQQIECPHEMIQLKNTEHDFIVNNLQEKPIVSLLRDFSAPIILKQDLSQEDLVILLKSETDGFAKWDASQKLALMCINSCYQKERQDWELSETLIEAYQYVLNDNNVDAALRAEILTLPTYEEVAVNLKEVDSEKIEAIRDFFQIVLGRTLFSHFNRIYVDFWQKEDHTMTGIAYSRRRLRNVCLRLMMKADEANSVEMCQNQFKKAITMTDQLSSLNSLVNCRIDQARQTALDSFYQQWQNDDLVLDKWFAVQAGCELPDTLNEVEELLNHPAFNIKNPNKIRSLIGAFTQNNPRHFHALDGSGYAFLTDMLIKIDKFNPQIAARLATPFSRWQNLNEPRRILIKHELKRLTQEELSRDLNELVLKSLVE